MKRVFSINKRLTIVAGLMVLALFTGCKKEEPCKDVVQGDFVLVE